MIIPKKSIVLSIISILVALTIINIVIVGIEDYLVERLVAEAGNNIQKVEKGAHRLAIAHSIVSFILFSTAGVLTIFVVMRHLDTRRQLIQASIDALPLPMAAVDGEARLLAFNRAYGEAFSLDQSTDLGKSIPELHFSGDGVRIEKNHYLSPDGKRVLVGDHIYNAKAIELAANNQTFGYVVVYTDIGIQAKLENVLAEFKIEVEQLDQSSLRIADASKSFTAGLTEQAASLAQIAQSMDDIRKRTQLGSEMASRSTQLAEQSRNVAELSEKEITEAITAMNSVHEAGAKIVSVVKLIDDIAFQTNLLALNAAVEAARAGRHGKGFAVVADEVRNLAGRSAKAVRDTAAMVEDMTGKIGGANSTIAKLHGVQKDIVAEASKLADSAAETSASATEQARIINQIGQALSQIDKVAQHNAASIDQTAEGVANISQQIGRLRQMNAEILAGLVTPAHTKQVRSEYKGPYQPVRNQAQDKIDPFFGSMLPKKPGAERDMNAGSARTPNTGGGQTVPLSRKHTASNKADYTGYAGGASRTEDVLGKAAKFENPAPGDKVIGANQRIILDDSDFGRY